MPMVDAEQVALAAREMAARFQAGATLFAVGDAADARHVAVEFMHPVIVGKRAIPAIALDELAQLRLLAKPGDIALGIKADDRTLATAGELGLLTIALSAGDANHSFVAASDDPLLVDEFNVTIYHLLWELTHVFLEHCSTSEHCSMSEHCSTSEHCATCSDEAVEVTVVELRNGGMALVDTGAALEEVSVALVDAEVGGRLLVHAKEAITVIE